MDVDILRATHTRPSLRRPDDDRQPAFTALAVLSLALGIGANTAIYSFMDSILLRSLPVSDPESLVVLNWHAKPTRRGESVMYSMSGTTWDDEPGEASGIFPFPAFELFRKIRFGLLERLRLSSDGTFEPDVPKDRPRLPHGEYVSGDYFRGLGVPPAAGRLLIPDDDRARHSGGGGQLCLQSKAFRGSRQRRGAIRF